GGGRKGAGPRRDEPAVAARRAAATARRDLSVVPWTLHQIEQVLEETGSRLVKVARTSAPDVTFHIPWFERDFTVFQGLGQVLTHSINHRADINQWLPRFGVDSTELDYINLALSES